MKLSKIKSNNCNIYIEEYNSINELVQTINSREQNPSITSTLSIDGDYRFTGTHSYEEAENLLLHGWTEESEKLNQLLKLKLANTKSIKNTYNVSGFQCSVPRYLQGIPTSMIDHKITTKKQKVITITKGIAYAYSVSKEKIEEESIKVLQLINSLENQGCRVILNVMFVSRKGCTIIANKVRIKNANERLNLSKISFPLVHPSYLRRINLKWIERFEYTTKAYDKCYGVPMRFSDFCEILGVSKNENEYFAEAMYRKDTLTLEDLIK